MFNFLKNLKKTGVPFHPERTPRWPGKLCSAQLKALFEQCGDFETRVIGVGGTDGPQVTVCWLDGLASGSDVALEILRPLTEQARLGGLRSQRQCLQAALSGGVYGASLKKRECLDDVVADLLNGRCAIVFDQLGQALTCDEKSDVQRGVSSPEVEKTVKGGKDAFIETLRTNTTLLRRRLRTPNLKIQEQSVGRKSATRVALIWLDGVANPRLVEQVTKRLDAIDIDAMLTAGEVEQYLIDRPGLPFPQMLHTERPDRFAACLAGGRVGLLVDGLPLGFVVPATLPQLLRVTEDSTLHFTVATMLTILRWLALAATLLLPAAYVAVAMYHQEMLPLKLLESVITAKQAVPFSTAAEVLGMLIAFELLQEAGLRLPNPVGETVSIIGALIVGQSAVEARVISPIAVIVVAMAGVCGYTQPSQDLGAALRLMRFGLTIAAVLAGLFGIMIDLTLIVWLLCTIDSFGVAYLSPLCDASPKGWMQSIIRMPRRKNKLRETALKTPDQRREA